jgi:hypothetical protein
MDFTVSTSAIVSALYNRLPSNGSELVLFDVNRTVKFGFLLRDSADTALTRLLPAGIHSFRVTIITNADGDSSEAVERTTEAGGASEHTRALGLTYPTGLYSLSHVALPFPMNDSLYGLTPDPTESFGVNLGALAPRGERNVLIASLDSLLRVASNPFFPYMIERIDEGIDSRSDGERQARAPSSSQPDRPTSDEESRWTFSFNDAIAWMLDLVRNRSDPSPAPP